MEWKIEKTNCVLKGGKIDMTLTPFMEKQMQSVFEIEMLQGEKILLTDGRINYKIEVSEEKGLLIKEALLKLIANESNN